MESSQAATVSAPATVADPSTETSTASTATAPSAAVNSQSSDATPVAVCTPAVEKERAPAAAATTNNPEQSEPKIEQVTTPADMETETSPSPVSTQQEAVDPLAVPEESPEISTTSVEGEKSTAESTLKEPKQAVVVEKNPPTSNDGAMSDPVAKPSTSSNDPAKDEVCSKESSSELSESLPTSTSSPGGDPTLSSSNVVEEETSARRSSPVRTPPPVVESSTASPEKLSSPAVSDSRVPLKGSAAYSTSSTVDSSSSDKAGDSSADTAEERPSSNCKGSDSVNSINNSDCSSNSNEAESQATATDGGSKSQEANTTTSAAPNERIRSPPSSEIAVPTTAEVTSNAVIGKESRPEGNVDPSANGVVIEGRPESGKGAKESEEGCEKNPNTAAMDDSGRLSGRREQTSEKSSSSASDGQTSEESQAAANSSKGVKEQREGTVLECRESAAVPPEPDPGPPVAEESKSAEGCKTRQANDTANSNSSKVEHHSLMQASQNAVAAVESSPREDKTSDNSDSSRTMGSLNTGAPSRPDYHQPQQQQPPVSARNPLQFTEVANDEVELKVDGGHLLDRVIKLSLLKGLQDSGKRLAKSSLIISGAGASVGEGANGEATLATTSSLSKAKSAAAGLRLMEEHKTTPPALVANGGVGGSGDGAQVPVKEPASSTKEVADSPQQTPSGGRIRHSSETTVSSSPSGELDGGVRSSSSNSSLDFREEERSGPTPEVASPASSSLEASSSRSSGSGRDSSVVPNSNDGHLPVKARKPQYYASIPDFSKQQFASSTSTSSSSSSSSSVPTSTTTATKSLTQLHMKTPDFSCLASGTASSVPSSQTSPSSTTTNSTISTAASMNMRTTSELKISNPDFTKGFAAQHAHYGAHGNYPPTSSHEQQQQPGNSSSPYVSQDTFSKLIKERNYIADLQLKNPPPSQGPPEGPVVVKGASSQNEYPPSSRGVVVDTTSSSSSSSSSAAGSSASSYGHAPQTSNNQYRRSTSGTENGVEQEPKAHVIHKSVAPLPPPPASSQPIGGHHAPKTWNPPEFSSKHFTQAPPAASHNRPSSGANGSGPSSTSPSSRDPSPAPSSSSPHQPPYGPAGGLVNYAGKAPHAGPTSVVGTERIIVNNVRTYYPEASVPPSAASAPNASAHAHPASPYTSLPKVKDPEFRLDHNKEQLLLQEGTIVTVKQPYPNHTTGRGPIPGPHAASNPPPPSTTRSPSAERREAQMMQNSQDILYRDYKQHKKPTSSSTVGMSSSGNSTRPPGPPGVQMDRRSPYDTAAYYAHQHRPPVVPPQAGGLMHPPPPNWPAPGPGQHHPSHQLQRGPAAPGARNSPQDMGASPVSSPAPPPPTSQQQHHYQQHQGAYYGQYKNAPSPVSGSTYGSSSSPSQPQGAGGKYPPQQQHYAGGGSGTTPDRRHEVMDRGVGPGNYKGLDFNMEQKFAEVYQAHQAKEKQAAAEAAHAAASNPSARQQGPRHGPAAGAGGSPGTSSTPGGPPTKGPAPYGPTGYEQYHPYYQHSQATPSPTSTPSPVPSPHHRKYSGPPSRDPSPLGQQPQQPPPPHHRYGSSEPLYHIPPGAGPPTMYMHSGPPKPNEQGVPSHPPGPVTSYYQSQPSSSSSYSSAGYPNRPHHAGGIVSPSQHHNSSQQSVISGNSPYDRYAHPYTTGGPPQPTPGGQVQQQPHQQQQSYQAKPSLPYPPAGRQQGPPPLQPTPPSAGAAPSAVIHPPVAGSKNIPVRVIATAPPASSSASASSAGSNTLPTAQQHGPPRSTGQSNASSSSAPVPPSQAALAAEGSLSTQRDMNATVVATTPVIIAPKRESPLDLSVKTVKTKADSTGCDDYATSASNSSISSSSSNSSVGNGRPREVVPKVDFSPNFQKHIPPRGAPGPNFAQSSAGPPALGGRPPEPHLPPRPTPSPTRHVSVISPAIPPGYDKKTDAYLSANYRAVGGPLTTPAYQYPPSRSGPMPGAYEGSSSSAGSGPSVASASSKSVYYPPAGPEYGRPGGKTGSGSIVTGQAAPLPASASNSRSNPPSHGGAMAGQASGASQPRMDDPRIEDRKFVESMLKKKTSPSSDVMADLQAGKFPTRIPQGLVPKKRAAAAAAAAAAAEAALTKQGPVPSGSNSPAIAPTPAKVAKYEDPQTSRSQALPPQGSSHASAQGAPSTFDGRYGPSREGPYPSYGPPGHHYPPAGKRPSPPEMSNGPPAVHPSVITTNYHHHPQAILQQHHQQQQQQQHQQQQYDARYYQHHAAGLPPKARDDHVMPVYHQPHLRGGSAAAPYTAHAYGGYAKEEPNAPPHPPYPPHPHTDPAAYHKESHSFRYGESLKPPQEHTAAVHHMQSHIHYTGGGAGGAMAKVPHQMPPHPQQQQQQLHHQHQQSHSQAPHHLSSSQSTVASDAPMGVPQYPPSVHPSYGPAQHHRGADQSVISKLRTSLEQKEYEKQRINQLRKQPPGVELPTEEDRPQKTSIASASPVAASIVPPMHEIPSPSSRFRTKGELKGYTPLPTPSVVSMPPARSIDDPAQLKKDGQEGAGGEETSDDKKRSIVPPADLDGASALDILDWGSACNEFVEQLQTGKKRGRRKRAAGTTASAASTSGRGWPAIDSLEPTVPLPEGASTDLSAIPKEVLNSARSPHRLKGDRNGSESSSDEDKPLLLLRQQSQQQKEQDGKGPVQPEKVARNHRERQRLELEQKHEAKLGRSSSTDSETARVASAAAQRAKARVRKLRHRSSVAPTLSLKSSDGDGDVTADGGEEDGGKPGSKRRPHALAPNAKRKRTRGPGSRTPSSSAASSSCGESSEPGTKKSTGNEGPKKRGRPKGTRTPGSKRGQQSSNSRCQSGAIKQEPNENSDLSSDDEPRAVRTPHKNGSSAANNDSARKRGDATGGGGGGGAGGPSGGGGNAGGKAQHGHKVNESSACNGGQKDKTAGAKKKFVKTRTNSRSKAELSSDSSSSSSGSSSSEEEEEEEEAEETMTRSRSKREAERRRSNSKVLRNDKIVENCPNPGQNQRAAGTRNRVDSERTPSKKGKKERKLSAGEPTTKRSKSRVVESDSDGGKAAESSAAVPRKRTRQASKNAPNSSAGSGESANSSSEGEEGQADMAERLRSRKVAKRLPVDGQPASRRQSTASATKGGSRRASTTSTASSARKKGASGASSSSAVAGVKKSLKELNQQTAVAPDHFYPGWEKELYEYKRSLKVPPELITIDGGLYMHRISTSLPDLDSPHHSDGSETFSEIVKKLSQRDVGSAPPKRFKTKAAAKQQQQQQQQPLPGTSSFASTPPVRVKEEEQTRQERKKLDDNEKFSSIIELLHRRCLAAQAAKPTVSSSSGRGKGAKGAGKGANSNNTSSSESTKPKQEYELLPTPGAESESLFSKNSKKKKSLFDTAILKSRTRTEQKAMQSKEMIREVFGGDGERPQSAPPLSCDPEPPPLFEEGLQNVTYDEKYNELMRNVDRIVGELDGGAVAAATTPTPATVKVKQEPPEEEEEEDEEDDEDDDDTQDGSVRMKDSERDTPSIASERGERELPGTPLSFNGGAAIANGNGANGVTTTAGQLTVPPAPKKRGRGHRTSRRKGSSGFDYIRKKKKPSQQHSQGSHGNQQHGASGVNGVNGAVSVRKVTAFENMEGKDETHISKEIRSWVLNKGVGESVMHKAARLGYTDVIVYCLERLDMDPDLKDNAGYTPLHEACAKGHLDIANYLLQYGASHSEPAPSGMRPLHEAVENSFVEIVRLLLAFGADPMLATYAGMTPIQLAESDDMTLFLEHHLKDVQSMAPNKTGWKFDGPWKIHDPEESGCNVFSDIPGFEEADSGLTTSLLNTSGTSSSGVLSSTSSKQCDSNSNIMHYEVGGSATTTTNNNNNSTTTDTDGGPARKRNGITAIAAATLPAGLRNGKIKRELPKQESEQCRLPNGGGVEPRTKLVNGQVRKDGEQPDLELHDAGSEDSEGGGEINFEYEESDRPLPPLYVLKDEYNERWMLMSDLCTFLKFKSKEAVLRQICPNNSPTNQRELIREMKIEEFLTRANCLQLLCAGEKLNIHASKVVLVKYNDSVKSLLQVQSYATRI